jgi:hypothetical protein
MIPFSVARILTALPVAAGLFVLSPAALAATGDEELVSAARTATPPPRVTSETVLTTAEATPDQVAARLAEAPPLNNNPTRRIDWSQVHGSAGVAVGTGGYKSAYVSAVMPVGDNGILGIAVSQTDYGKNGYMPYVYSGAYPGRGSGWGRGGRSQSLSLSYMNDGGDSAPVSDACAPGFSVGSHTVEPVWVTRMHGGQTCDVTTAASAFR